MYYLAKEKKIIYLGKFNIFKLTFDLQIRQVTKRKQTLEIVLKVNLCRCGGNQENGLSDS